MKARRAVAAVRTAELEEAVLAGLAAGKGMLAISKRLGVARRTIRAWQDDPSFAARVKIARAHGYEVWAEEILTIAAEAAKPGKTMPEVTAARLEVDSRKWLLSKLHPERFGDRVELTGKDGRDLIPIDIQHQAIPRLLRILAVLLPGTGNSELFNLATVMVRKLKTLDDPDTSQPKALGNGAVEDN